LIFLKLGGSLITDKSRPETARLDVLVRLAQEIAEARRRQPGMRLLLGHGSGSFGHMAAARFGTRQGARTPQDWLGFAQVWWAAHRLNRHVMDALLAAGLPAMSFPPSSHAACEAGALVALASEPVVRALDAGLLPVVQGDVAFDRSQGATILSTEQVMGHLADELHPDRVLLAGSEQGIYARFPPEAPPLAILRGSDLGQVAIGRSAEADVTGGMADKVDWCLRLAARLPKSEIRIFSGLHPGSVRQALSGAALGTRIAPTG
jgi:isopentenyl phosphate kinase